VRIVVEERLLDAGGFSQSKAFARVRANLHEAIDHVRWPEGGPDFAIKPTPDGNGVRVIKNGFIGVLLNRGWKPEHTYSAVEPERTGTVRPGAFDAWIALDDDGALPFVAEWETGNISSSHRALNKMALGLIEKRLSGGVLVLPTRDLYRFLTDRVGNFREIEPYFPVWRYLPIEVGFLAVIAVEHDRESYDVPQIPKGTDGRALG
jgi:hypothetical protein